MQKPTRYIPALILIALITYFSRQPFSQQDISPILNQQEQIIQLVQKLPQIQFHYHNGFLDSHANPVAFLQFIIRKAMHLLLYGFLGLSLLYALRKQNRSITTTWIFVAIIVTAIAAADEYNQLQNPNRTGCPEDILMDLTGYILLTLIAYLIKKLRPYIY